MNRAWRRWWRTLACGMLPLGMGAAMATPNGVPPGIEARVRAQGPVIDVPGTKTLYEPLLAKQPREGVRRTTGLAYGSDERHRLDVYAPEAAAPGPRPVLVFVHGGGFVRGDKADRDNAGYFFAREGFVTAVPNYRLGPKHRWPAGAEDIASVLRWLRQNAAEFGGDPQRIVLMGESAGAAHVAAATLVKRFHPPEGLEIVGAVLVSGVYNARLEALARRQFGIATPDPRNEAYFGPDTSAWGAMSTVDLVDAAPFPILLTYAEMDPMQMQVQAGELFARLVSRHGFSPDLHVVRGHNHLTQVYSINTGDESLTRPVLEFLRGRTRPAE
ncbi:alpha/beta hydrolase [Caldimonas tepidiphila]|uniref:alpha/beta hydrolase n=1 Tax=Caldimonas tepidiphila TaxID=2315841 RepID=UPI001F0BC369|nr:alpha/beta hydrolase [Caldimonas tepidiphila]